MGPGTERKTLWRVPTCYAFRRELESHQQGNCARHVDICSSSSRPWSFFQDHPRFVCPSNYHFVRIHIAAHPAAITNNDSVSCILEKTYSHRDQDESGFQTSSQNQTLVEAELTHLALTCQCLLENGVGSDTSVPVDPQISVVADESRRQEVSQFQSLSMWNCSHYTFHQWNDLFEFQQSSREDGIVIISSHQEIDHLDSNESKKLSTIHEHWRYIDPNGAEPMQFLPSHEQLVSIKLSVRFEGAEHSSVQFQHLFSRDLQSVTQLLWRLCIHISSCIFTVTRQTAVFTSFFLKRTPRDAEIRKMSWLEDDWMSGILSEFLSSLGQWNFSQQLGLLLSFLLCPQPFSTCEPNASSLFALWECLLCLAYRNYIIVFPLVHCFFLNCSKLCTPISI